MRAWPLLLAAATVGVPHMAQAAEHPACGHSCLIQHMSRYLRAVAHSPHDPKLPQDAVVRENGAAVGTGSGIWQHARRIRAREDFADVASAGVYSRLALQLDSGRIVQLSVRLRLSDRAIHEVETIIDEQAQGSAIARIDVATAQRASREQLLGVANGYLEAIGTHDVDAARIGRDCQEWAAAGSTACLSGLDERQGQQVIERRFPVVVPELGVVVAYGLVMHHECLPPRDDLLNARLSIVDGRIVAVEVLKTSVTAPGHSGFDADFPAPAVLRAAAAKPLMIADPEPPVRHFPGYWRLHALLGWFSSQPASPKLPQPPYTGIADERDVAYGPDPRQRLDVLWPKTPVSSGHPVLVFVHGGGWIRGDKHFQDDVLYENVVYWAALQGMVAVNLNYRLADYTLGRNLYPTQEQDVAAAVEWIGANIGRYGGNPKRIFLWGHSAGGSTIATYVADAQIHGTGPGVRGVFLLSSPLDPTADEQAGQPIRYFGSNHAQYLQNSPLRRLIDSDVPVLIGYSPLETDLAAELEQAVRTLCAHGHCPTVANTRGTHDGEVRSVGSADHSTTDPLLSFMASIP